MTSAIDMTRNRAVIVYNVDGYSKLGQTNMNKAMRLIVLGKAEIFEADESKGFVRSAGETALEWLYPKAIRLLNFVKVNYKNLFSPAPFSKNGVRLRDNNQCAYCPKKGRTIDHIIPRSRGGANDWMNTVTACFSCNNRKDDKTPEEAGLKLRFQPWIPTKAELLANRG
jgi:hypothetical protein